MYRSALLFTLTLLLAACASTSGSKKSEQAAASAQEASTEEATPEEAPAEEAVAAPSAKNINLADIPFVAFDPENPEGPHVYPIYGNPREGAFAAIVRLKPGFMTPLHSHSANYTGVVMSDGWVHGSSAEDKHVLATGSSWFQPAGEAHIDGCEGEAPCHMLAFFDGAVAMTPAEAPAEDPKATITKFDAVEWADVKDGIKMFVINGNPQEGAFQALYMFPAGTKTSIQKYSASLAGALLKGDYKRGESEDNMTSLSPGAIFYQPAGTSQQGHCGADADCFFAGGMDGPLDASAVEVTPATAEPASAE